MNKRKIAIMAAGALFMITVFFFSGNVKAWQKA